MTNTPNIVKSARKIIYQDIGTGSNEPLTLQLDECRF